MTNREKLEKIQAKRGEKRAETEAKQVDFINQLENKFNDLKETFEAGIEINNVDSLLLELEQIQTIKPYIEALKEAISKFKFPELPTVPKAIDVKGLPEFIEAIKKIEFKAEWINQESTEPILERLDALVAAIKSNKPSQDASDYMPVRRVQKIGNTYQYDDGYWGGSSGGGSGNVSPYQDNNGNSTFVTLLNGAVPITEASLASKIYDDGSYVYECEAVPGTGLAAASWRITRYDSDGSASYPSGSANFLNAATNLTTVQGYSYS